MSRTRKPPAPDEVEDAMALVHLSRLVQSTFGRVADRHGLTPVQGQVLCVLAEQPRGMGELARIFGVGKANLTGLVDRAEQRNLVERSLVPGDRRAVQVALTEEGRRAAHAFHDDVIQELTDALAPLPAGVRAALRETAVTVVHADRPDSWGPCRTC